MLSGIFQVTRVSSFDNREADKLNNKKTSPEFSPPLSEGAHKKPRSLKFSHYSHRPYHLDFQQFISSNPSPFFLFFPGEYYRVRSRLGG